MAFQFNKNIPPKNSPIPPSIIPPRGIPQPPKKEKSFFELQRSKGGVVRRDIKDILKKIPPHRVGGMSKEDRLSVEQEIEKGKYGERINEKELNKVIKEMQKKSSKAPLNQDRVQARHKKKLLETVLEELKKEHH